MVGVAVLGAGGVGGLVAAALARAGHDTTVVAREPTAELIAREGITVESAVLGDFVARPRVAARLDDATSLLIVATKATALAEALERIEVVPGLVVPLLNGVEHLGFLRERFGARVPAATIRVESTRVAPGHIAQTSADIRIELASEDPALRERLAPVAGLLTEAGIDAEVVAAPEARVMWSKLARLCPLACTTSAADATLGAIRADPRWAATLADCAREVVAVARAEGAELEPHATLAELDALAPDQRSSMARDLTAGREPELDAIAGAVLRAAARNGLACPTLVGLVETIEARVGERLVWNH